MHATLRNFFIYKELKSPLGNYIEDFRPISATPYFFKLLEMILKSRIEQDIEEGYTKRINLEQYGFEKHLETEPQVLRLALD